MASQLAAINTAVGNAVSASPTQFLAALQRHEAATTRRLDGQGQHTMGIKTAQAKQAARHQAIWSAIQRINQQLSLGEAAAPILDMAKLLDRDRGPDPAIFVFLRAARRHRRRSHRHRRVARRSRRGSAAVSDS
eukprot:2841730-Pyramimonas_sp.AAC.1